MHLPQSLAAILLLTPPPTRLGQILNLFVSSIVSLYCIWCIWSLHEAMMLGGEAASKAGFSSDEISGHAPLMGDGSSGGESPGDKAAGYI